MYCAKILPFAMSLRKFELYNIDCELFNNIETYNDLNKLDISRCKIPKSMSYLSKLHCLTYLSISNCVIEEVPDEIGYIPNLITLSLYNCG